MMKQPTRKPIPSHEHAEAHQPQIISNETSNKKRKATTHNTPTSNEKRLKLDSHAKQAIQLKCPICPKSFKSTEALMQGLMPHLHSKHKACTFTTRSVYIVCYGIGLLKVPVKTVGNQH